ncbi:hypothetical protein MMC13_002681 [Lambiella insularis]|nr:hypothetical protein [Lambiella insularis]
MDTVERSVLPHEANFEKRPHEQDDLDLEVNAEPSHNLISKDVPPFKGLSLLDRFLVIWIILAMALGIILGHFVPSTGPALQRGEFVGVSIPIAIGLLVMIWAFLPDRTDLRQGLIFVGIARCVAMVLIWNELAGGDGDYCAVLVAFNSILQIILFAPIAIFYIKIVSHDDKAVNVSYSTVARSVAVFLGIPLAAAIVTRVGLRRIIGERNYQMWFIRVAAPWSLIALIFTIIVLFASQGEHVVTQITSVLRVCAPLLVYFAVVFTTTVVFCKRFGFGYRVSCTQSFTAASNNFELAIAVVVAIFGAGSNQALASTVGPLIEVPVLVALVYFMKWFRKKWGWAD